MVHRDAVSQTRDSRQKATAFVSAWSSGHRQDGPKFRRPAGTGTLLDVKLKISRHHANHGVLFVVEGDGLAHHTRLATEATLPQSIAEYSHLRFACFSIVGQECATENWIDAEHLEEIRGGHLHRQVFGFAAAGEIESKISKGSDLLVARALLAPRAKVPARSAVLMSALRRHFPQHHDAVSVSIGKW